MIFAMKPLSHLWKSTNKVIMGLLIGLLPLFSTLTSPTHASEPLPIYEGMGGDFTLKGHNGIDVSLSDYQGKVVLIFFGYTHCPDICPVTMSHLKILMKKLGDAESQVQTLFISIDPERDNLDHLKNFVTHFHPSFMGLTAPEDDIVEVALQYGAAFFKQKVDSAAGYLYAHTSSVFLIDQKAQLRGHYKTDQELDALQAGVESLLSSDPS